jgi:hypothetical protein
MSPEQVALMATQRWAALTILHTLTYLESNNPNVPFEQLEILQRRTQVTTGMLFRETLEVCGQGAPVHKVINTLVKKVLDWVVVNHKTEK